jgi:hypothetical protein
MLAHDQEDAMRRFLPCLPARSRWLFAATSCMLFLGILPLGSQDFDLVQLQKKEAERRKALAPSRFHVDDANMNTLPVPKREYHFTLLHTDHPSSPGCGPATSVTMPEAVFSADGSGWESRRRKTRELESQIEDAQANIGNWESRLRTIEMDCAPYAIPDRDGYIAEKSAQLQRWIAGERYFVYLTKKRLAEL